MSKRRRSGVWGRPGKALPDKVRRMIDDLLRGDADWTADGEWFIAKVYDDETGGDVYACRIVSEEPWGSNKP